MTTKDAAEALGMSELSVKMLMQQGRLDIGNYIKRPGKKIGRYHIDPGLLQTEVDRRKGIPIKLALSDEDAKRVAILMADSIKEYLR